MSDDLMVFEKIYVCGGFNTSVNPPRNFLRCFGCLRDFNPVEIVMHWPKTDFVNTSVKILKDHYEKATPRRQPAIGTATRRRAGSHPDRHNAQSSGNVLTPDPGHLHHGAYRNTRVKFDTPGILIQKFQDRIPAP